MTDSWALAVDRQDLSRTVVVDHPAPSPADGEAVLRVDRVGMTANNVTYAVLGESFRYWNFFPGTHHGLDERWGLAPVWGFADVVESRVDGVVAGQRVYGYLPPAAHLLVRPGRVDAHGFRDASEHRAALPTPYNVYASTTGDHAYEPDAEDLLVLFRPLFFTSFMLADQLVDEDFYGAQTVVMSSASSKTAYAAAYELSGAGPRVIGLTSPGNVAFTQELGCYDEVLSYDHLDGLPGAGAVAYVDLAGSAATRQALRERLGSRLVVDLAVGLTHQTPNADDADAFFFAPTRMRKRSIDWGREGLNERFGVAWRRFSEQARRWVDVSVGHGAAGLREAWLEVLSGRSAPRTGHVISMRAAP